MYNLLETKLLTMINTIIPITKFTNRKMTSTNQTPLHIKKKINLRKRQLKKLKGSGDDETIYFLPKMNFY